MLNVPSSPLIVYFATLIDWYADAPLESNALLPLLIVVIAQLSFQSLSQYFSVGVHKRWDHVRMKSDYYVNSKTSNWLQFSIQFLY